MGDGAGLSDTALITSMHYRTAHANAFYYLNQQLQAPGARLRSARDGWPTRLETDQRLRIPYEPSPKGKRIEVQFPDPTANPYLAFMAMLMAGVDESE